MFTVRLFRFLNRKHSFSISEQKHIIDSMPEPKDDYDRAFFNYLCNYRGSNKAIPFLLNLLCTLAIPVFLFIYFINKLIFYWNKKKVFEPHDVIIISAGNRAGKRYLYNGIIPKDILHRNKEDATILEFDVFPHIFEGVFDKSAFNKCFNFFMRHPLYGFINLRCLINIMGYNHLILRYTPKSIVNSRQEFNCISSITTLFCEDTGIEYINFMHGEVLTNIQAAFVRFSKFYIWDEHYRNIFVWGRCPREQFVVYTPDIYAIDVPVYAKPIYFLTYIFTGNETTGKDTNAEAVKDILIKLSKCGLMCKVRPHPRWSDIAHLTTIFANTGIVVENPRIISPKESILLSKKIAGTFSTMLSEAYYMKKDVVIDDMTDPALIYLLQDKMYLMLEKRHELLSEVVQNSIKLNDK